MKNIFKSLTGNRRVDKTHDSLYIQCSDEKDAIFLEKEIKEFAYNRDFIVDTVINPYHPSVLYVEF